MMSNLKTNRKTLEKVKFKAKGLFVMNASLRSSHGNAFLLALATIRE